MTREEKLAIIEKEIAEKVTVGTMRRCTDCSMLLEAYDGFYKCHDCNLIWSSDNGDIVHEIQYAEIAIGHPLVITDILRYFGHDFKLDAKGGLFSDMFFGTPPRIIFDLNKPLIKDQSPAAIDALYSLMVELGRKKKS